MTPETRNHYSKMFTRHLGKALTQGISELQLLEQMIINNEIDFDRIRNIGDTDISYFQQMFVAFVANDLAQQISNEGETLEEEIMGAVKRANEEDSKADD